MLRAPRLNIYPTANEFRLAWNVITFSRNPLGVYITQVDAANGKILSRENKMLAQAPTLPYTADIYPNHPEVANPDTDELKLENGQPAGLLRVNLRNYNAGTNATGVNGLRPDRMGDQNVLAAQQPFRKRPRVPGTSREQRAARGRNLTRLTTCQLPASR